MGAVSRRSIAGLAVVLLLVAVAYLFLLRGSTVTPRLVSSQPVAVLGSGEEVIAVAGDGTVLAWLPPLEEGSLPRLPLEVAPKSGRLQGPALEQARVLAATPATLLPYVESSYYGESGVDVNLTSGIELRFGNASQAARKWRAAAAILADPSVTTLDYVNVQVPTRPMTGGSGHTLPPFP
jgi:hypothetical protein